MTALETWLQTPLAMAAGWALFHSLWEGAIIAVVLAAALAFTRSVRARYTAACLAIVRDAWFVLASRCLHLFLGIRLQALQKSHPI